MSEIDSSELPVEQEPSSSCLCRNNPVFKFLRIGLYFVLLCLVAGFTVLAFVPELALQADAYMAPEKNDMSKYAISRRSCSSCRSCAKPGVRCETLATLEETDETIPITTIGLLDQISEVSTTSSEVQ